MTITPASGRQYVLVSGGYRAVIASVGASLRELSFEGRDLVVPFAEDQVRPFYRGATLAPWPNRVIDGAYSFEGQEQQLPLTEPERSHALHGLVTWLDFAALEPVVESVDRFTGDGTGAPDRVELSAVIVPQAGYPHRLRIEVAYVLASDGLTQTIRAINEGESRAPYGSSGHPYLIAGAGHVDDWMLDLPASDVLLVTDDRLLPAGRARVDDALGGSLDFRTPRRIGDTFIDHAFTSLSTEGSGAVGGSNVVRVTDESGSGVSIRFGDDCPWVQVHTGDRPEPEANRVGLAVEPMTCPPDAFNSGEDLVVLEPGASHEVSWTIGAIAG